MRRWLFPLVLPFVISQNVALRDLTLVYFNKLHTEFFSDVLCGLFTKKKQKKNIFMKCLAIIECYSSNRVCNIAKKLKDLWTGG